MAFNCILYTTAVIEAEYKSGFKLIKYMCYLTFMSIVKIWEKIDHIIMAPHCCKKLGICNPAQ